MKIKKYDYLINDNGDIWTVQKVHRDGAMTIGHSDGSEITYSAGEMEAWFRKIPSDEGEKWFEGSGWVDPAPYWQPKPTANKPSTKHKSGKRSSSTPTSIRGMR